MKIIKIVTEIKMNEQFKKLNIGTQMNNLIKKNKVSQDEPMKRRKINSMTPDYFKLMFSMLTIIFLMMPLCVQVNASGNLGLYRQDGVSDEWYTALTSATSGDYAGKDLVEDYTDTAFGLVFQGQWHMTFVDESGDIGMIRQDGVSQNLTAAGITDATSGVYAGTDAKDYNLIGTEYVSNWHMIFS